MNTFAPSESLTNLNCRVFEVCAAGGILLTEDRPSLARCFEENLHYLAFQNFSELVDKIDWIAEDKKRSDEVRLEASRHAHQYHSYEERLKIVFRELGMLATRG